VYPIERSVIEPNRTPIIWLGSVIEHNRTHNKLWSVEKNRTFDYQTIENRTKNERSITERSTIQRSITELLFVYIADILYGALSLRVSPA